MRKKFSEPELNVIEELSAKLLVANEKLRKSEEKRTKMLENISHDLRAPLTAIRSAVDYLLTVVLFWKGSRSLQTCLPHEQTV